MKRKPVVAIVMVMVLALVIAPSVWAQGPIDDESLEDMLSGVGAEQAEHCYPADGYCNYITFLDNENNAGTGVPDNDMGSDGGTGFYCTCTSDAKHPIEFNVAVSAVTYNVDAVVLVVIPAANDPARIGSVFFNGLKMTDYYHTTTSSGLYDLWVGRLNPSLVHAGDNLMEVYLRSGACVPVMEAILFMYDHDAWAEEDFVPEPATIALLGSGLAGLAGYATLGWRRRE